MKKRTAFSLIVTALVVGCILGVSSVFWLHQDWSNITVETYTASEISNSYLPLRQLADGQLDLATSTLRRQLDTALKNYAILKDAGLLQHDNHDELVQKAKSLNMELDKTPNKEVEPTGNIAAGSLRSSEP